MTLFDHQLTAFTLCLSKIVINLDKFPPLTTVSISIHLVPRTAIISVVEYPYRHLRIMCQTQWKNEDTVRMKVGAWEQATLRMRNESIPLIQFRAFHEQMVLDDQPPGVNTGLLCR